MRWDSYSVMTAHQVGICVLVLGDPVGSWRASCALARVCGAGRGFVQYADELTKGYTKMVIAGAAARPTISASNFECAGQRLREGPAIDACAAQEWAASKRQRRVPR